MLNNSSLFDEHKQRGQFWHSMELRIVGSVLIIIGVLANSLVLVVVKSTPSMHSVTNVLLCNLAISDIVSILSLLSKIAPKAEGALHSNISCKVTQAIPAITVACSVLTLSLLAMQRYQALANTMMSSSFRLTLRTIKYAIIVIWILAVFNGIPILAFRKFNEASFGMEGQRCKAEVETTMKALLIINIVLFVALPFLITLFCCYKIVYGVYVTKTILNGVSAGNEEIKMKKKLVRTTILSAMAFTVCYAPGGVYSILLSLDTMPKRFVQLPSFVLVYLPICLKATMNPFLYAFQSTNYRTAVKVMFRCQKVSVAPTTN